MPHLSAPRGCDDRGPGPADRGRAGIGGHNNACSEDPPLSGIGIAVVGAQSLAVQDNTVSDQSNVNPSIISAGIVVTDGGDFGGGQAAADDISFNTVRHNIPNDIDASGTIGTNSYHANVCQRSNPAEICDRTSRLAASPCSAPTRRRAPRGAGSPRFCRCGLTASRGGRARRGGSSCS